MTPPASLMDNLSGNMLLRNDWRRRGLALLLLIVFGIMALFPRQYRVVAALTPTDPSSFGLSGALNQLGAMSNVFGGQAAVEIGLKIARSTYVRQIVAKELKLGERLRLEDPAAVDRWLTTEVSIRSLRGGIIQIETKMADPVLAKDVVTSYSRALSTRLTQIARQQTAYKRQILEDLVNSSGERLDRAQAAYDQFRRVTRYSQPTSSIEAIGQRIPVLEAQIKAKQVELQSARAFATDNNPRVRQIIAEAAALQSQLREARSLDAGDPNSVNRVVVQSTRAQRLERELSTAQSLFDSYRRFLEGTAVENLTSSGNVRVLEPPYIDSARQFRTIPAGLFLLVLFGALAIEFYLMRPPVGSEALRLRTRA